LHPTLSAARAPIATLLTQIVQTRHPHPFFGSDAALEYISLHIGPHHAHADAAPAAAPVG
jgi:hypothetical protein